ncbi:IS1182 family transposase [Chitinophaga rhizophila]|uniref:IS1182 family transposase n=1 Tax=Chitinophaga rhizophila TaxID=2866212 RepID=A0ABS7GBR3_9BACT|nr:IS1182 family transposase [Chitinophaga rhizophila]MBW8685122.1 IS1182 family transposase [Chitinophaga rhizophila]
MARGKTLSVVFKSNFQNQGMLLPPDINDLIPQNHPVRTVNDVLERVDISELVRQYKPGGTSSYHPRMLLKILVYAYINNIYSSRKIEEAVSQHIHYMWLSGMSTPDHNTINRFRGKRLQKSLQPIFTQVVLLLCEEGLLSIKDLYTDGTKIEANANRYTFVWGNAIKHNKEKIKQQLNELWQYAQSVAASELDDTDPSGFDKIDKEKVSQTIEKINEALKGDKSADKKIKQKLNYAKRHWPAALEKYEQQEKILGEQRSSYSKTDPDATFMRMKEDHMKNGQLKPAYNVQISTNNQFIASYSVHQQTTDTNTLITHLQDHIRQFHGKPNTVKADAGYGSEQNYQWLENKKITAYVKHSQFDRDQNNLLRSKKPYTIDKLEYDPVKDRYYCPTGKPMKKLGSFTSTSRTGYERTITRYQAKNCEGCPLRSECHQQKGNRIIEVNHNWNRLKQKADKRLKTKRGICKRKQRCFDTEPVFANIKHNHHFKRFMLRGIDKVSIEMGLLALAHNLRKKVA